MNKLGETNSDEWEKIKGWMGAANGKKDHPLVQEAKRAQRVQKFDEGGDVQPDDETMKFLQPQGAGLIAPSAARTPMTPPVQAPPQMPTAPVQPSLQMPPQAPPQMAPAPTQDYSSQAANELGTSPQELAAFIQKANTPTTGDTIRGVGASLADALGRAGGSNPNYLEQNNKVELARREAMTGIPGKQAEVGKEKFGLSQTLGAQDPNSQYSKINQNTFGPDLVKMGLTPQQVQKMPASLIGDLLSKKITLEEAKARIEETGAYQQGMLQNTRIGLEQAGRHQQNEDVASATARQTEKDKAIAGGSSIPFVGPSHAEKQAAFHRLAGDQGAGQSGASGPYGPTTIKNGVEYEWSPVTGKYHPK